jgi:hypothetical protein
MTFSGKVRQAAGGEGRLSVVQSVMFSGKRRQAGGGGQGGAAAGSALPVASD